MKVFIYELAIGSLLILLFIGLSEGLKTEQPISFNHKKHTEQGIECFTCHPYPKNTGLFRHADPRYLS
jgi:hypothetical protein